MNTDRTIRYFEYVRQTLSRAAELADEMTPLMTTQDSRERVQRISMRLWDLS